MLPRMENGDWMFWGIITFIGINFVWMALLSEFVTQWIGLGLGVMGYIFVYKFGPRPKTED